MYAHLPLSRRVIRSHSKPPTSTNSENLQRGSYRQWDDVNMQNAMIAVEKGEPVRRAAEMFNVPKSTTRNWQRSIFVTGRGRRTCEFPGTNC